MESLVSGGRTAVGIPEGFVGAEMQKRFPYAHWILWKVAKANPNAIEQCLRDWSSNLIKLPVWLAPFALAVEEKACLRLNHRKGQGCTKGNCGFRHVCMLCGTPCHGVFEKMLLPSLDVDSKHTVETFGTCLRATTTVLKCDLHRGFAQDLYAIAEKYKLVHESVLKSSHGGSTISPDLYTMITAPILNQMIESALWWQPAPTLAEAGIHEQYATVFDKVETSRSQYVWPKPSHGLHVQCLSALESGYYSGRTAEASFSDFQRTADPYLWPTVQIEQNIDQHFDSRHISYDTSDSASDLQRYQTERAPASIGVKTPPSMPATTPTFEPSETTYLLPTHSSTLPRPTICCVCMGVHGCLDIISLPCKHSICIMCIAQATVGTKSVDLFKCPECLSTYAYITPKLIHNLSSPNARIPIRLDELLSCFRADPIFRFSVDATDALQSNPCDTFSGVLSCNELHCCDRFCHDCNQLFCQKCYDAQHDSVDCTYKDHRCTMLDKFEVFHNRRELIPTCTRHQNCALSVVSKHKIASQRDNVRSRIRHTIGKSAHHDSVSISDMNETLEFEAKSAFGCTLCIEAGISPPDNGHSILEEETSADTVSLSTASDRISQQMQEMIRQTYARINLLAELSHLVQVSSRSRNRLSSPSLDTYAKEIKDTLLALHNSAMTIENFFDLPNHRLALIACWVSTQT